MIRALPAAARALGLVAAPVFAAMALATAVRGGAGAPFCGGPTDGPLGGMTLMYLLMTAVHLAPWLRWAAGTDRHDEAESLARGAG